MLSNFLLRCMEEWTKIQLSYYYGLNIFIPLPLISEFERRLRNQRIPAEGWAAAPEGRFPTASQSHEGCLPGFTSLKLLLRPAHPIAYGLADSGASPEQPPSPEQNRQKGWGSSWKQEISPLRSWLSMWTIEDYTLLHITRSVWLSEKLCYGLGLRDSYASPQQLLHLPETGTANNISGHIALWALTTTWSYASAMLLFSLISSLLPIFLSF